MPAAEVHGLLAEVVPNEFGTVTTAATTATAATATGTAAAATRVAVTAPAAATKVAAAIPTAAASTAKDGDEDVARMDYADLREDHGKLLKKVDDHHASVEERVAQVEAMLGDLAGKMVQEVRALKLAHDQQARDFDERMDDVFKLVGDVGKLMAAG